jgi:hypothetical protein
MAEPRPDRDDGRRTTIATTAALVLLYLVPIAGRPPSSNPNELARLELAVAIAEWGTVDLDRPARLWGLSEDVARRDGRILSDKAPGLSLAAVPVVWALRPALPARPGRALPDYWPLRHLATGLLVSVASALVGFALATAAAPEASRLAKTRVGLAVLAALTTPMWTYGTVFLGHAPAAVLVATAWLGLLGRPGSLRPPSDRAALAGGLAAGLAVTTEYPTALLVAVVFGVLLARRTPLRTLALAGLGIVLGVLPALVYHQIAFGAPWLTGYAFKADPAFRAIHGAGIGGVALPTAEALWGVLGSPARGLFAYSPLLLLAPIGLVLMGRRHGWGTAAPYLVAAIVYVGFAAGFVDWQAGWGAAARHLVPLVPLLAIPSLTAAAELARRPWSLLLLVVLASMAAVRTLLTLALTPFFPPTFTHPLRQLVLPSLVDGAWAPTLPGSVVGLPDALVWSAVAAAVLLLVGWSLSRLARRPLAGVVAAVLVVSAVQIGWMAWRASEIDPGLEAVRARVLVDLGHSEAAARVAGGLDAR